MHRFAAKTALAGITLMIAVAFAGLSSKPIESAVKQSWQRSSQNGHYSVELIASDANVALGVFQTWRLSIRDQSTNEGVTPVRVMVGGGMPAHGHGLPTQPQVTEHLGDGQYQVEGLMFNMAGQWQLIFDINTRRKADRVIFDVVIEH